MSTVSIANLQIDKDLFHLVNECIIPDTNVEPSHFWNELSKIIDDFMPKNKELLKKRCDLQEKIDAWHKQNGKTHSPEAYKAFLKEIGYLIESNTCTKIDTKNIDPEIASMAGPQLVVPVDNARYSINAANARWGSLYDAVYGTDVLGNRPTGNSYNEEHGAKVVDYVNRFLDEHVPLANGKYADAKQFEISGSSLNVTMTDGSQTALTNQAHFAGFSGSETNPEVVLLVHNGLHIELQFDRNNIIGKNSPCGLKDVVMESALTTIQDCEDSVAAVDAEDKIRVYRNWLGLMKGDLSIDMTKNGKPLSRKLRPDRHYKAPNGSEKTLPGRSLLLVRNVGHLMTCPAVTTASGEEVPEGILDAMITSLAAIHDIKIHHKNSRKGSVYIVKPKMHGPEEVQFTVDLFSRVEQALDLAENTLKIGIMDEERRTSINLGACIEVARSRLIFINTGFLDRTGDEIHTSMHAGAFERKGQLKNVRWIHAYENNNVDIGLECGLSGVAQIGKGMWAQPDNMAAMMEQKIAHPLSGANTAWVPSPVAATLHAMHYHKIDVFAQQAEIAQRESAKLDDILCIPVAENPQWSVEEITEELDNNCQGLLGYVVRWVNQGVGCSKVLDISNVGLMEDRATLRISSQHIANWLHHGIISKEQVEETLRRMALIVDNQNATDSLYEPMGPNFDGIAFKAAQDLIYLGMDIPNGYTEPTLHSRRLEKKKSI